MITGHYTQHIDSMFQKILDRMRERVNNDMTDTFSIQQMYFAASLYGALRDREIEEMPEIIDEYMVSFYENSLFDGEAIDDAVKFICRTLNFYWEEDEEGQVLSQSISMYPKDFVREE